MLLSVCVCTDGSVWIASHFTVVDWKLLLHDSHCFPKFRVRDGEGREVGVTKVVSHGN